MLTDARSMAPESADDAGASRDLAAQYRAIRHTTETLCEPLSTEDYVVQSMPEASPAKWHLAHTTWFFETFALCGWQPGYRVFDPRYAFLFNSYYNAIGPRIARHQRGLLTRPTVEEVSDYRRHVDEAMLALLEQNHLDDELRHIVETGMHHEQQHQELLLTDIKHLFALNPLRPAAFSSPPSTLSPDEVLLSWLCYEPTLAWIGARKGNFAFDNECPRHCVLVPSYFLASRLVTNVEYLAFMESGGYDRPEFWLSDGWETRIAAGWHAPLYWEQLDDRWHVMSLTGIREIEPLEPVCHVSFYEAAAYAAWAHARLPTEAEWESAAAATPVDGNLLESGVWHPLPAQDPHQNRNGLHQLYGDVWEWTRSAYAPYPGYRPAAGALGEYNGKFMCNQFVLRGGSCATPRDHLRASYRNFFGPATRWQFTGIRLARDV